MSPGLLGIKTRPQLNKISLSLPHIDPWAHIHGHILYIDIHTQICIHTCTHPVMPQWAPCHNEGPCMYVTMNKTLLCEVYYWCKGDNIFCCWGSKRQNLFFHRFSCQCVWPSHTHTHRSSYTVHKCKCILMSSYPANTSEVNTHTHTYPQTISIDKIPAVIPPTYCTWTRPHAHWTFKLMYTQMTLAPSTLHIER